jgi:hypothetical protein
VGRGSRQKIASLRDKAWQFPDGLDLESEETILPLETDQFIGMLDRSAESWVGPEELSHQQRQEF